MKSGMYRGYPWTTWDGNWSTLHDEGECKSDQHGAELARRSIRRRQLRIEAQQAAYEAAMEAQCASSPR